MQRQKLNNEVKLSIGILFDFGLLKLIAASNYLLRLSSRFARKWAAFLLINAILFAAWPLLAFSQSGQSPPPKQNSLSPQSAGPINIYVGYADNLRANPSFPVPWQGSPNVLFLGNGPTFDAGAVRIDNISGSPLSIDSVVVDLQRPGPAFNLWGSFTIPANGVAILTQTSCCSNFDTSDYTIVGCGAIVNPTDPRIPKVTITIAGVVTSYLDTAHVLDTGGYDLACQGNESLQWRPIGTTGVQFSSGHIYLNPNIFSGPTGSTYSATATVTDASDQPAANVSVTFTVLTGPNAGKTGQATTNAQGQANFSYSSTLTGTDTLQAVTNSIAGTGVSSNTVTITWNSATACH